MGENTMSDAEVSEMVGDCRAQEESAEDVLAEIFEQLGSEPKMFLVQKH